MGVESGFRLIAVLDYESGSGHDWKRKKQESEE